MGEQLRLFVGNYSRFRGELKISHFNTSEYFFFAGAILLALVWFNKRKWWLSGGIFAIGGFWLACHASLRQFIQNLGADSLAEVGHLDWHEMIFWLGTSKQYLGLKFNLPLCLSYVSLTAGGILILRLLAKRTRLDRQDYWQIKTILAVLMLILAVHQTVYGAVKFFYQNAKALAELKQNFTNPLPRIISNQRPMNVLVYIGESTTSQHMGVYGYPRNTTPNLTKLQLTDPNFILFYNAVATHTATSFSLLEALSFAVDEQKRFLPINQRKRCALVDMLHAGGVTAQLFSTQNMSGSFNLASTMIFGQAQQTFAMDTRYIGNNLPKNRIWDHDFFTQQLMQHAPWLAQGKTLTFFHSYAGHGDYWANIPPIFRRQVDNFFTANPGNRQVSDIDIVEHYDAAIKYVDFALARAINFVKTSSLPVVLLYFSDHGEAADTNNMHDASCFQHDMIRIPFLLYFNHAARLAEPELFAQYKNLAAKREIATLAQLPATILDILGVTIAPEDQHKIMSTPVFGAKTIHPPIVVRDLVDKINFINLNQSNLIPGLGYQKKIIDNTDRVTRMFVVNH